MKKNLLTLLFFCAFCCFSGQLFAQVANCDPAPSAGTVTPPDIAEVCLDGSNIDAMVAEVPTEDETLTTDYDIVVTTPPGTIAYDEAGEPILTEEGDVLTGEFIIGVTPDGTFDFAGYEEATYCFTGFAYNQEELDQLAQTLNDNNGLIQFVYPGFPILPVPIELQEVLDAIAILTGPITIDQVVVTIEETLPGLGGALPGLPNLCYAVAEPYCLPVVAECAPPVVECEAFGGDVAGPEVDLVCNDGSNAADLAVEVPGPDVTNTTDFDLVVTTPPGTVALDEEGNPLLDEEGNEITGEFIIGLTADGVYDFTGNVDGTYCFTGFAYNQTELDDLAELLNNNNEIINDLLGEFPILPIPVQLQEILDAVAIITGPVTIDDVVTTITETLPTLEIVLGPIPEVCFDVGAAYCLPVGECIVEPTCDASFGEVDSDSPSDLCLDAATVSVTASEAAEGYTTVFVVTSGEDLVIEALSPTGDIDLVEELGLGEGDYTVHAFNYLNEDEETILAVVEFGVTTGGDVAGLIADEAICAALDVTGFAFTLADCPPTECEASFGDVDSDSPSEVCIDDANVSVTASEAAEGFSTIFVITSGEDLVIEALSPTGDINFTDLGLGEGDYTVHAFNYLNEDEEAILAAVELGVTTGGDVAGLIADGAVCAALDVTGFAYEVVDCPPTGCEASFGDVDSDSPSEVCIDDANVSVTASEAAEGFSTIFVITSGEDLVIEALSPTGDINFTDLGLGEGDYTVHAFNYLNEDEEAILAAVELGVTTGGDVAGLIADGVVCAALDVTGFGFAVVECTGEPIEADTSTEVNEDDGTYTLTFTISGGAGDYTVEGAGSLDGDTFTSDAIDCGTDYSFAITDAEDNTATVSGDAPCEVAGGCTASFGTVVAPANTFVCAGGVSEAVTVTDDNTDDFTTLFVVTQGEDLVILGLSADGTIDAGEDGFTNGAGDYTVHAFNYDNEDEGTILGAIEFGVTTGGDVLGLIGDGTICAALDAAGTPFVILEEIALMTSVECDGITQQYTVTVTVSGGLPAYDSSTVYSIGGTLFNTDTGVEGNPFTIGPSPDGGTYLIEITDLNGCGITLESDEITCSKCPEDEIGDMPTNPLFVCEGGIAAVTVDMISLSDTSFVTYVLHDAPGLPTEDGTIASSANGTFSLSDAGVETNTQYYISAVAGVTDENGDGIADLSDECTKSVPGTPVVFLEPVTVNIVGEDCDPISTQATLLLTITGGYPGFDDSAVYSYSGINVGTNIGPNQEITTSGLDDGTPWSLTATDGFGCSGENGGDIDCEKTDAVDWLAFTGEVQVDGNLLKWATATEDENEYFSVESSLDGINFTEIGRVDGNGTTIVMHNYQFLDKDASSGTTIYRITQHDYNGQTTSTNTISLTRGEATFGIQSINPVPAVSTVNVVATFVKHTTRVEVNIYNVAGKLMDTQLVDGTEGINTITFNVANYTSGMYLVKITDGTNVAVNKFVK